MTQTIDRGETPPAARAEQPRYAPGTDLQPTPWAFDDNHRAWRETVRTFARQRVAPGAAERSRAARLDPDLVREVARLGITGLLIPEPYGSEADLRSLCVALEELAYIDSSVAITASVAATNATLLWTLLADRDDLRDEVLPGVASGDVFSSFSLTEPSGGSDATNISTVARRDTGGWVLDGAKQFITNSGTPFTRYTLVFAATGEPNRAGRRPISIFLVPTDAPGVTVAPSYDKLGWRSSDTHPVFFDSVRLPESALLGTEGGGVVQAFATLRWARISFAAIAVGLARACLDETLRFTSERSSFGQRLSTHQAVGFKLADMAAEVSTAALQVYDAAWKYDCGHPVEFEAATCKLVATEIANRVAYDATQLHGGYGFMNETAVVRHYQDARVLTLAEGTSEVQRLLLARYLGASD